MRGLRVCAVAGAVAAMVAGGGGTAVAGAPGPEADLAYHGAASMAGGGWTCGSPRATTGLPRCRTRPFGCSGPSRW